MESDQNSSGKEGTSNENSNTDSLVSNNSNNSNTGDNNRNNNSETESEPESKREETPVKKPIVKTTKLADTSLKGIARQPETIEDWVAAKVKYPSQFGYTSGGDLYVPSLLPNQSSKIITLPKFVPGSTDYMTEFFETKRAETKEPAEQFSAARRNLEAMVQAYRAGQLSVQDVLAANKQVADAEALLNDKLKMPRSLTTIGSANSYETTIRLSDLTLNWYDFKTNVQETASIMEYSFYPVRGFWMSASAKEEEPPAPLPTNIPQQPPQEQPANPVKKVLSPAARAAINARRRGF
jgi:hypothetical protein